jgi:hypothetical protein
MLLFNVEDDFNREALHYEVELRALESVGGKGSRSRRSSQSSGVVCIFDLHGQIVSGSLSGW